jgi:short-subunit dehydrogenase
MPQVKTPTPADGLAWITGASSGIGAAVAMGLVRDGWTVLASARRADALQNLAGQAQGPGRIIPLPMDMTDAQAVASRLTAAAAQHGPVALAIMNAGSYAPDSARTLDLAIFRATIEVNLMGAVNGLAAVLPAMIERGRGHVVTVASVAGYSGLPRSLAYGASKAALINFTESLKLDAERYGLKVQLVCPGFIKTPLTDKNDFPMPFLMPVETAAERMIAGMKGDGFEITFPRRFALILKFLRMLPYAVYFGLTRKATKTI